MKKKSLVGIALAAVLAMGVTPAFGAEAGSAENPTDVANGEAATTVKVQTVATNIAATVPLNMTVVGPAEGGKLTGVPNNYNIVNKSVYPIKVASVKADMTGITDWTLKTGDLNTSSTPEGTMGDISLYIQPEGTSAKWNVAEAENKPTDWVVDAKTATDTTKNLVVSGSISPIKSVSDAATTAVKIVYTIAPTTI